MPGKDGYELMRQIREGRDLPPGAHASSRALTSFTREEDRTRAMDAGFDLHLAKPIDPRKLLSAFSGLLHTEHPVRASLFPRPYTESNLFHP